MYDLVPGKKLCRKCKSSLDNFIEIQNEQKQDPDYVEEVESSAICSKSLNDSLISLNCSHPKAVRREQTVQYGKRKFREAI